MRIVRLHLYPVERFHDRLISDSVMDYRVMSLILEMTHSDLVHPPFYQMKGLRFLAFKQLAF